ncbi:hypothetical protein [Tuberibacillus calidus]|uniref:hypothetical protein n=1 Tax=Tuberibacillus calidus TaxID=340097 RepID=UPI000400AA1E|nr:hypothetical protein [Tuberibacillus calidus]
MNKLEKWERFFDLKKRLKTKQEVRKELRFNKELFDLIRSDMRLLEDYGYRITFTELALIGLMDLLSIDQNENGFYHRRDKSNLSTFLENKKKKKRA